MSKHGLDAVFNLHDNSASDEVIDVLVGDWMSELNMPSRAFSVSEGTAPGMNQSKLDD